LCSKLVLNPSRAAPARQVSRVKALGDDALEAKLCDAGDEILGRVDDDARERSPCGPVERPS
jgi:hypothetical protein